MQSFLLSIYPALKALHVISVIAWMAGMMYLPRLFIYHHQAVAGGEAAGFFQTMERRLLKGIMTPALVAVWLFASLMLIANPSLFATPWFQIKFVAVVAISAIHGFYSVAQKKFEAGVPARTERFWRFMNEAPFILLILVVFMAVAKPFF